LTGSNSVRLGTRNYGLIRTTIFSQTGRFEPVNPRLKISKRAKGSLKKELASPKRTFYDIDHIIK